MKVNLHTHTWRCRHATGSDEDYVLAAINAGYTKLGFSDHNPFPYTGKWAEVDVREMRMHEFDEYRESVLGLKEKYKDKIEIVLGLECEPTPEFFPFLKELRQQVDYLILGNHGDWRIEPYFGLIDNPAGLRRFVDVAVEGMETGLFLYLAHPDLMFGSYPVFDQNAISASREICREANRLNMPLEYNLNGVYKGPKPGTLGYPCNAFWEIAAEENCRALVGVDAHFPEAFDVTPMEPAVEYLKSLGMTVLDDPMKK